MMPIRRINAHIVRTRGWQSGTDIEDHVACHLSGVFRAEEVSQQHRVGRYRIDFAWPDVMIGLEVDGWYHRSPMAAARDAERDANLRAQGWLILRIDDRGGWDVLDDQLGRVCRVVHALRRNGDSRHYVRRGP